MIFLRNPTKPIDEEAQQIYYNKEPKMKRLRTQLEDERKEIDRLLISNLILKEVN